ncbi:hypothetical protein ACJIZ3_001234 [Penstemon smallii]|uniref:SCP domain-containing protein n=1 Tax=Penstemon smallii TaxID=265156 RepID=A0ABD3U316_9LAMI
MATTPPSQQNSHQDFLDAHNRARVEVGVQPLVWNKTVANYALKYAHERYGDCNMEHSMGPYGENLAEGWGILSGVDAVGIGDFTGQAAVNLWVRERPFYDPSSNTCVGGECRHYTQVVWRNSVRLGCARGRCSNGSWFISCNYDPPGNFIGQRPY